MNDFAILYRFDNDDEYNTVTVPAVNATMAMMVFEDMKNDFEDDDHTIVEFSCQNLVWTKQKEV